MLYRDGLQENEFEETMRSVIQPVYQSAANRGFKKWILEK